MTGRERVLRCLSMDRPDRAPRDLWMLSAAVSVHGSAVVEDFKRRWPTDFTQATAGRKPPKRAKGNAATDYIVTDEWGCVFETLVLGIHGEVKNPLVDDWSKMDLIQPPVELLEVDVAAVNAYCRSTDKFTFASGWGRLFERMQFLRGSENLYMDLAEESDELKEMIRRVHGFYRTQYEVWARTECNALALMDDWGSQQSLLISPAQWRRLFKPCYAEYVKIAHDSGKKFFMHSDGYIFDIYEDLIEIGVDAINSQIFCMDVEEIGRRFGGRITFWGEIDRQNILPFCSVAEVEKAVERAAAALWRNGGAIAQFEWGQDTPLGNVEAAYRTWQRLTEKK